jgi:hypothetical protein
MATLPSAVIEKQKKADWFTSITHQERKNLLSKYSINRNIEDGTLLNQDVFFIYDEENKR